MTQREIKFRAYSEGLKRMVQPEIINLEKKQAQIKDSETEPATNGNTYVGYKWIPLSDLMQYTGLTDKNGKEIWESDVVKIKDNDWVAKVYFFENAEQAYWGLIDSEGSGNPINKYANRTILESVDCEVIGNVYENSNLLKDNAEE